MKKGAVFTLDALLAAILMIGAYFIISDIKPVTLSQPTTQYELLHYNAEDALELFSLTKFNELNATEQQDLLENTDVDESDVNKSLIDIVTLLWATNNVSRASSVAANFFTDVLPADVNYRLLVQEVDGNTTLIREQNATQPRPSTNSYATKSSRLVSGFKQNRTVNGYIARSIAVKSNKNTTSVFDINPEGSGHTADNNAMNITKWFYLPVNTTQDINKGTLYISIHSSTPATTQGYFVVNNGSQVQFSALDGLIQDTKGSTHLFFGSKNIQANLRPGWNTVSIVQKSNSFDFHSHIHPGTRIEVTYKTNETISRTNPIIKTEYLDNIISQGKNSPQQRGGVWTIVPVYVPASSTVHNVSLFLNFTQIYDDPAKNDIQIYFNGASLRNVSAPIAGQGLTIDLTGNISANTGKTNVVTVYGNAFFADETQGQASFWSPQQVTLFSDPQNFPTQSSRLFTNYSIPLTKKKYGYIDVSFVEPFGGNRSNPKLFLTDFQGYEAENVYLHLAQLDSIDVIGKTSYGSVNNTFFDTPMTSSTPTKIFIDKSKFNFTANNTINMTDICNAGGKCDILANSSLEYEILVPSQVGYGDTFNTAQEAQEDANARLNQTLSLYAEILETDLYTQDAVSSAPIPYLYGPVTVTLELWR